MVDRLIWLDLEMTGLDPEIDRILEVAVVVTDDQLNIIAEGPSLVIGQPIELLDAMQSIVVDMHTKTGLLNDVKQSELTEEEAEQQVLQFLSKHVKSGVSPMCGNTIGQDRRFLTKYMSDLCNYFHYRNLDVTSVKILHDMWQKQAKSYMKPNDGQHRALFDVYQSIEELKFYQKCFFKLNEEN